MVRKKYMYFGHQFASVVVGSLLAVTTAARAEVDFQKDILNGIIKSIVFAFVVMWIAVYKGYDCEPTSEGISRATTSTVVQSSLLVLCLDFILTALMFVK